MTKPFDIVKLIKSVLIGLAAGSVNGLFGSGGGTIVVPAMITLLGMEEHKSHATAIFIILPLTFVSTLFYIRNNYVDWDITLKVVLGGMAGGFIGAKLLHVCPAGLLRKIFAVFIILTGFRMLKAGQ